MPSRPRPARAQGASAACRRSTAAHPTEALEAQCGHRNASCASRPCCQVACRIWAIGAVTLCMDHGQSSAVRKPRVCSHSFMKSSVSYLEVPASHSPKLRPATCCTHVANRKSLGPHWSLRAQSRNAAESALASNPALRI
eukprot:1429493-Prymnesium_polylepis.2